MARPVEPGLRYYTKNVDFYDEENYTIKDLSDEYGPIGLTIYEVLCCLVYKDGYYTEVKSLDWLAKVIRSKIGSRWIKSPKLVLQVIHYCADIGLIHKDLLQQNVITSVHIQQAYQHITARKKVKKEKYWLLDENGQPLLSAPKNIISVAETRINAVETRINAVETRQDKKRIDYKYYSDEDLNKLFLSYLHFRTEREDITKEQIKLLKEKLDELGKTDQEKQEIIKQSLAGGYKNFFPVQKKRPAANPYAANPQKQKLNAFRNFEERSYDFDALEQAFDKQFYDKIGQAK